MRFANPLWLWLFVPLLGVVFLKWRYRFFPAIRFSLGKQIKEKQQRFAKFMYFLPDFLQVATLMVMIIALARPQLPISESETSTKGVDVMLLQDVSPSMAAEDLQPTNRLVAAKQMVSRFIAKRTTDRLGLVVFGADAYTQCPLTTDYGVLQGLLDQVELGMAGDGTAIGMAIATGLNRLKQSPSESKVMILVTDGDNNRGEIDPMSAAVLAKDSGVKVYTIGVGKEGGARIPFYDPVYGKQYSTQVTKLDETLLKSIAKMTGGQYFRAVDSQSLSAIYDKIDAMEKHTISVKTYHDYLDYFPMFLWATFVLVILEFIARMCVVRIP